ncbi:MAG: DUF296 domain-containing protein [Anaerococcus sp.]|jgi:predicted DNA-binding protein with PD1-like motif|nr:DUF296 domain-containing protein [Peptoniphilaceae bacterium]MDY3055437.1 DUF296 domain-containing protein [Anaerococcus sp.]
MIYKRFGNKLVVRLFKGEKIVESLHEVLNKEDIKAGSISGLGAVKKLDIGYFNPGTKAYKPIIFDEYMEVTSLVGNVSRKDGEVYTHLHIVCGREDASTVSGHLNEAEISLTAEIFVDILDGEIERSFDEDIGINVMDL